MKLKIKKNILMEALNNVSKAIDTKNLIPILSGIKFNVQKDKVVLTASDNDITIETIIEKSKDVEIGSTGSIVIKGKYLIDIVRKLESEFINIEIIDDHKIMIYTENSEFNLNGIDSKEYPNIDLSLKDDFITLKNEEVKNMILQTNYATSNDEARVVLTGINIKTNKNTLEVSATDSYRLSSKKIKLDSKVSKDIDIIVPSKNISELYKVLPSDNDENINIHIFDNKIIFEFDNIIFQSRLINGSYPNTKNLIPEDKLFDITFNKAEFYNMIDRASILNSDSENNIITLEIANKLLKITSLSYEIGKVEEKAEINTKENIKISFSSRYMLDALKTIRSENVVITFVGEIKPILLKEENNDDLIELILPIRTY